MGWEKQGRRPASLHSHLQAQTQRMLASPCPLVHCLAPNKQPVGWKELQTFLWGFQLPCIPWLLFWVSWNNLHFVCEYVREEVMGNCPKKKKKRIAFSLLFWNVIDCECPLWLVIPKPMTKGITFNQFHSKNLCAQNEYHIEMAAFHPSRPIKLYEYKVNTIWFSFPSRLLLSPLSSFYPSFILHFKGYTSVILKIKELTAWKATELIHLHPRPATWFVGSGAQWRCRAPCVSIIKNF